MKLEEHLNGLVQRLSSAAGQTLSRLSCMARQRQMTFSRNIPT